MGHSIATPVLALLLALIGGGRPAPEGPAPIPEFFRRWVDAPTGLAFDVPLADFHLETRHFDALSGDDQIKHAFFISGPGTLDVTIELYANTARLGARDFFDKHLGFMRDGAEAVTNTTVARGKVSAILVERPRQPGSYAQPSAIFALGRTVLRVTCNDGDDPRGVKVFARILDTIELERR